MPNEGFFDQAVSPPLVEGYPQAIGLSLQPSVVAAAQRRYYAGLSIMSDAVREDFMLAGFPME